MERMLAIPKEYAAFQSAYLIGGYHDDAASLDEVEISRKAVRGCFRMTRHFVAPDREFELSVPIVIAWSLQLSIIYGCAQHGFSEARDLVLREISLKCLRPVTDPERIEVRVRLRYRRPMQGGMYYVGDIDVDDGCFAGRIGFSFPTD
jgi:hypothetical protein